MPVAEAETKEFLAGNASWSSRFPVSLLHGLLSGHTPGTRCHARTEGPHLQDPQNTCRSWLRSDAGISCWCSHLGAKPTWTLASFISTTSSPSNPETAQIPSPSSPGSTHFASQLCCLSAGCGVHPIQGWPHRGGQGTRSDCPAQTTVRTC